MAGLEQVAEHELRDLYSYWAGKRQNGTYPSRRDIDPGDITPLLPYVLLLDVLDDGLLRFRLVGTDAASGVDPTGRILQEAAPEGRYRDHLVDLFLRGATGPGALYTRYRYSYAAVTGPRTISRLFMPLASNGSNVDVLMIGQMREATEEGAASAWQANPPKIKKLVEVALP